MAEAGSDSCMFSKIISLQDEDIETGCNSGQSTYSERIVSQDEVHLQKIASGRNKDGDHIDEWVCSMARVLEDVPQYMCHRGHPGRICRIPENLCEVDKKAYEPYFLSIGPYHHGNPKVQHMERRKCMVLKCVLENTPELSVKDYLMEVKSIELAARSFYSDIEMESEKFVRMLLLDSVFIITMFCGMPESRERLYLTNTYMTSREDDGDKDEEKETDVDVGYGDGQENTGMMDTENESNNQTNSGERWFQTLFVHDLCLLENQLPFFVLQAIYRLVYGGSEAQLIGIMKYRIGMLLLDYTKLNSEMVISPTESVHHLLHLCHMFFRTTQQQDSLACSIPESSQMFRLGSAVQLYEAGVNFEARSGSTQYGFLDITFESSGKMVMPCLHVDDNTVSLFRNLIALEQMKYPTLGLNLSGYAVLLLHLVTTPEDVTLLRRKGIIQHHLASDKDMMYLVNRLSVGLSFDYVEDNYSLKSVFQELKRYTEHRVPRWRAWLKHRYFTNPWTVIALLAASLLLLLTALQTYYTVYSYYRPV